MQNPLGVNMDYLNAFDKAMRQLMSDPSIIDQESEADSEVSDLADNFYPEIFLGMMDDPGSIREAITEMSDDEIKQLVRHEDIRKHCEKYFQPIARESALRKASQQLEDN